jgi:hypothetical protein
LKVAFDEHVPLAMVRAFKSFAEERKLKRLTGGLIIETSKDYAPNKNDADYVEGSDAPWIKRFARAGGSVIVSGDTDMMSQPHERLALLEEGMIVIFFGSQWANWRFFRKCALLLHWWPVITTKVKRAKKGTFWRVPTSWPEEGEGKLQSVSTKDRRLVKIERERAAQPQIAAKRKARREASTQPSLFDGLISDDKKI